MRWSKLITVMVCSLVLSVCLTLQAGEFNQTLNIGDKSPAWKELPGTDGKMHSLSDFKDKDVVVLVFTCLSCEYAVEYEPRIVKLAEQYGGADGKVGFIAVCVNRFAADRLDKLTEHAKSKQLPFPMLYDESQKIAKDFGAQNTPEFFVIDKERKIAYMGAMDDDANDVTKVKKRFLEEALVAILKGEPAPVKETVPVGCLIRWARERR